jgi:monofunctional biosynthetic peptidoglycan transglycosylase
LRGTRKRRWALIAAASLLVLGVIFVVGIWISLPNVKSLGSTNPTTTAFMELRRREATQAGKPISLKWTWRPLGRISRLLQRAVLHTEDARFFRHEGVDWEAVRETAERDWKEKSMGRGGSTITQQVAKNLYLSPDRSLVRKLRELFIAWRLESALEKDRILELYLNIAEWGPGVFGAEAAARHWYGHSTAELTADQAARLALALPNPFKRSPKTRSRSLDRQAARVVRALHRGGLVSETELVEALRALGQAPTVVAAPPSAGEREEDLPAAEGPPVAAEPVAPRGEKEAAPPGAPDTTEPAEPPPTETD